MRNLIPPPPAQGTRYSLMAAAPVLTDAVRWQRGVKWVPLPCGPGESGAARCNDVGMERTADHREGERGSDPFYIWASDDCDAFGDLSQPTPEARVRAQLELVQSFHIAREFWAGAITKGVHPGDQVDPDEADADVAARSPYLADEVTEILDPSPSESNESYKVAESLGYLEQAALSCSAGRRIMLHVPVLALALLDNAGAIHLDTGGIITTAMGSIVAADAGYPGSGPDNAASHGGELWLYASTVPTIRVDKIDPPELAGDDGQTFDTATNDRVRIAQRLALYQLDDCCRFAIPTGITAPAFMAAGS